MPCVFHAIEVLDIFAWCILVLVDMFLDSVIRILVSLFAGLQTIPLNFVEMFKASLLDISSLNLHLMNALHFALKSARVRLSISFKSNHNLRLFVNRLFKNMGTSLMSCFACKVYP